MKELWGLGFLVNLFLLASVFDIYFKSPIVDVSIAHSSKVESEIQRVVFFVADGLRADTFYDNIHLRPKLTQVIDFHPNVAWGISHTRVPTESRPGHIALFAGFYEDPSAVFTGWKSNLVEFDSVFNRTSISFALGSPDVVNMFARGAAKYKMYSETYSQDWQDFLAANSSVLDTWVHERFENLAKNRQLPDRNRSLIFLHLLGIDNTGHATKPHSREYKQGLSVVDNIVAKVEDRINSYYQDNQTLFIFTADHGMTDWGSHGSGSKQETETPFVIWGPGIKKNRGMQLKQADFTPLISGSLGTPFVTNSVGRFPHDLWQNKTFAYQTLRANYLQLNELMNTKKLKVASERNFPLLEHPEEPFFEVRLSNADAKLNDGNVDLAVHLLDKLFSQILDANVYYERYDQQLLIMLSTVTFISLMLLIGLVILGMSKRTSRVHIFSTKLGVIAVLLAILLTKGVIGWPMWRVGYGFVPIYLILLVVSKLHPIFGLNDGKWPLVKSVITGAVGIHLLVLSFWQRSALSLILILNLIWALVVQQKDEGTNGTKHLLLSFAGSLLLALFPLVPTIGNDRSPFFTYDFWFITCIVCCIQMSFNCQVVLYHLIHQDQLLGGTQMKDLMVAFIQNYRTIGPLLSAGLVLLITLSGTISNQRTKVVLGLQSFLLTSVSILIHFPSSIITRVIAWISLGLVFVAPTSTCSNYLIVRLISIFLALATPFSFLGISYETLFLPALFFVLLILLKLEIDQEEGRVSTWKEFITLRNLDRKTVQHKKKADIHMSFRRAWFHLFFIFMSFFGTGNIASVSSFDPSSTRCFVSVFSPWVMMILMLIKILSPFLLVSSFWRGLLPSKGDVERNFGILLLFCQAMGLHMFFRVTNQGSWLEIGTSISHFVIVQSITLFLSILHFLANFLVNSEIFDNASNVIPKVSRRKRR